MVVDSGYDVDESGIVKIHNQTVLTDIHCSDIQRMIIFSDEYEHTQLEFRDLNIRELRIMDCKEGTMPDLRFIKCSIHRITRAEVEDGRVCSINGSFSFDDCDLREIDLNGTLFRKDFSVLRCRIDNTVFISRSRFEKNCRFVECTMPYCVFEDSEFDGVLDFESSKFDKLINIRNSRVQILNLNQSSVLQVMDLSGIEKTDGLKICMNDFFIRGMIKTTFQDQMTSEGRYRSLGYREPVLYWIDHHVIRDPKARPEEIEKKCACRNIRTFFRKAFSSENSRCTGEPNKNPANLSSFLALKKIMEDNERYDIADTILMLQKREERSALRGSKKIFSYISDLFGGYGMRPSYTLAMMSAIVLIFFALFVMIGDPYTGMTLQNAMMASIAALFSIELNILPDASMLHALTLLENIIGFLLLLYFTVILTRKIVR